MALKSKPRPLSRTVSWMPSVTLAEVHRQLACFAVNGGVAQRFLGDPEQAQRDVGRDPIQIAPRAEAHLQIVPLLDFDAVRPQRGRQADQPERRRVQIVRQPADAFDNADDSALERAEGFLRRVFLELAGRPPQTADDHRHAD
jgi:hypothetical protein